MSYFLKVIIFTLLKIFCFLKVKKSFTCLKGTQSSVQVDEACIPRLSYFFPRESAGLCRFYRKHVFPLFAFFGFYFSH